MSKKKSSPAGLQALYARVCGLDLHKKLIVACVRILNTEDGTVQSTLRKYATMTADLMELRQWLTDQKVTHVAMESTGIYWQPVFNLLESHFKLLLINAQHLKKVPGRKTDMKDAEWIAQLLQCGLLRPSFCPGPPTARAAGTDPPAEQIGTATKRGGKPYSEGLGERQYQARLGGH
jgi:hypothetical protein